MIDLNVRLDSSLSEDDYGFLARRQQKELIKDFPNSLSLWFNKNKKEDYETAREFALSLLQDEDSISYAVASLVHRLYLEGCIYAEIAITPYLHTEGDLNQRHIVKAALIGLNDALSKCPGMDANLILYCHREAAFEYNDETVKLAIEYRHERIVGVGLEGKDKGHPLGDFKDLFARARKYNYPVVVDLGKSYNSMPTILRAMEIGAKRIISAYKFEPKIENLMLINEKGLKFEFRPSYDVINGYIKDYSELPLKEYWTKGFNGHIASSGVSICNSSMKNQVIHLMHNAGFTREDVQKLLYESMAAGFYHDEIERSRIIKKFTRGFEYFYKQII